MSTNTIASDCDHPSFTSFPASSPPPPPSVSQTGTIQTSDSSALQQSFSRKRARDMHIEQTKRDKSEPNTTSSGTTMTDGDDGDVVVRGLRLEAIFHPKFDNERASSDIRSAMLERLCQGKGHLEVSLKHSGSLVLWSGSTRYYSKNSACNQFSRTAEILLRQRFETVRRALTDGGERRNQNENENENQDAHSFCSYKDCSRFVAKNRYTIALEVVAGEVLGDHGQIPNRDYVVVTAVADRRKESFLTTSEVLEFCHRYRLPHNDVWTFVPSESSPSSAEALFRLYDGSLRETGDTETTVRKLTEIADVYVPSPIPHSIYQGSICEGFIVRYVEDDDGGENTLPERDRLEGLARTAREILREVPSAASSRKRKPMDVDDSSDTATIDPVLTADLRALYRSISCDHTNEDTKNKNDSADSNTAAKIDSGAATNQKKSMSTVGLERERAALFSKRLEELLSANSGDRNGHRSGNGSTLQDHPVKRRRKLLQRHDLKRLERKPETRDSCDGAGSSTCSVQNHHLPVLTKSLVNSGDRETRRIAALLQTLDDLKGGAVTYTWMEKYDGEGNDAEEQSEGDGSNSNDSSDLERKPRKRRLYCIIHVHNDSTFFKFQRLQDPSDMTLFRGFCVEVLLEDDVTSTNEAGAEPMDSNGEMDQPTPPPPPRVGSGAPLMLKMKLLPYMVRTFVCRNLLKTIEQKGPDEFERIAQGLLEKWSVSSAAQDRWMPFFRGWANYVLDCKTAREARNRVETHNGIPSEKTDNGSSHSTEKRGSLPLGPLTSFSYLRHLEYYSKLYDAGDFKTATSAPSCSSAPESHTFVCIVSHSTEVSHALANYLADRFLKTGARNDHEKSMMTVCSLGEATKNRRSQSCVAYANVCDQKKGIKKFLNDKKVSKQSILILLVSHREEITALTRTSDETRPPSWLDITNQDDEKKYANMWRIWNNFPCAERIALGRSDIEFEPKIENATEAVLSQLNGTEEILDSIRAVGQSRIEQTVQQQSDSSPKGGILVFFPGIPGCGKSSLLGSLESKLAQTLQSRKTNDGDVYDRSVHIKEGDKIGKKFWNIVEDLVSSDDSNGSRGRSPPLVVADKNAPPASWPKLGQIRSASQSRLLPVLPDSTGLETTVIEGSVTPKGDHDPSVSHFYPFSLNYLAVSLSRVLSRPPGEHAGKLDSGFPLACMVVVQFYAFYRYIAADSLLEKLEEKLDKEGPSTRGVTIIKPVELPFVNESAPTRNIPDDLKQLLVEAIQLRHGHDKAKRSKIKKDDAQLIDLEGRLRSCLESHKPTLEVMSVTLDHAKEAFVNQILERMNQLSCEGATQPPAEKNVSETGIKLVSLDVDRTAVLEFLQKHQVSRDLERMFGIIAPRDKPAETSNDAEDGKEVGKTANEEGLDLSSELIEKTHVTMAFAGEKQSADALLTKFRHLQGRCVAVTVTGCYWNKTHAALQVRIASSAMDGDEEEPLPIPPCENAFQHMTIWFAPGYRASGSNELPGLVASGAAHRVEFTEKELLVGTLSFWNHSNEPIQL